MVLKYVDDEGMAQRFTYTLDLPDGDVALVPRSMLVLSDSTEMFGRGGIGYRVLSEEYLEDLRSDVERCRVGSEEFDSSLARVCEYDQYQALVTALSESDDSSLVDSIDCLIVDSFDWEDDESERVDSSLIREGNWRE